MSSMSMTIPSTSSKTKPTSIPTGLHSDLQLNADTSDELFSRSLDKSPSHPHCHSQPISLPKSATPISTSECPNEPNESVEAFFERYHSETLAKSPSPSGALRRERLSVLQNQEN